MYTVLGEELALSQQLYSYATDRFPPEQEENDEKRPLPRSGFVKMYLFLPRRRLIFIDLKGGFAYSSFGFRRERRRLERVC
jgi:hypothetical protein